MTESEVIALVRAGIEEAGSRREFARRHGLNASYVSDVMAGRRAPGPKILATLGLERVKVIEYRAK